MASSTLQEALGQMARVPVLWIPGLYTGLLIATGILTEYYAGTFFAGRLWIIGLVLLPLFVAGMLSAIKENTGDIRAFLRGGVRYYFRILLPGLVILFAGILTLALLMIPLLLLGLSSTSALLIGLVAGVAVPFVFVTYFFDVVAVFEESPVFETVRRSVEFVLTHISRVFRFYLVNIVIAGAIVFAAAVVWTALLYEQLQPLTTMDNTQMLTPEQLTALVGTSGIWATAVIFLLGMTCLFTLLWTYKACLYRSTPMTYEELQVVPQQGEYDSRGRWYKY
jgi:hypothetical protein